MKIWVPCFAFVAQTFAFFIKAFAEGLLDARCYSVYFACFNSVCLLPVTVSAVEWCIDSVCKSRQSVLKSVPHCFLYK